MLRSRCSSALRFFGADVAAIAHRSAHSRRAVWPVIIASRSAVSMACSISVGRSPASMPSEIARAGVTTGTPST
jgi:hypothetical protein